MAKQTKGVPITLRALIQRINRRLRAEDRQLKACRSDKWRHDLGDYYVIDVKMNAILFKHITPEDLGREIEVLAPWESVVAE